jgi:hypothetical protein
VESKEIKFADFFKGLIEEDNIGSSDDDIDEKMKNERLEKLGHSIKKMIKEQNNEEEKASSHPSINNIEEDQP